MGQASIGIIGGSGVYDIDGTGQQTLGEGRIVFRRSRRTNCCSANFNGVKLAFLPRHGRGHKIPPSEINFRANIDVLKRVGVSDVISVSAVGSLREHLHSRHLRHRRPVHRPHLRPRTNPSSAPAWWRMSRWRIRCANAWATISKRQPKKRASPRMRGGTYLVMEGPQFSSLAESELYRSWGCDVIGMTNMPEAKLAREAELCYATVAMVTDYDCWHPEPRRRDGGADHQGAAGQRRQGQDAGEACRAADSARMPRPAIAAAAPRCNMRSSLHRKRATRR